jgi:hypothetical protein
MSKQGMLTLVLGVAIGVNVVLLGLLVSSPASQVASGDTAIGTNGFLMTTGVLQGKGNSEALYIMDTNNRKFAVYFMNNTRMQLLGVRDMQYDFVPKSYSPKNGDQDPTVEEMRDWVSGG